MSNVDKSYPVATPDAFLVRSSTNGHKCVCYHYPKEPDAEIPFCNRQSKSYLRKSPAVIERMDVGLCGACRRELKKAKRV
jgi:hypothetical protein